MRLTKSNYFQAMIHSSTCPPDPIALLENSLLQYGIRIARWAGFSCLLCMAPIQAAGIPRILVLGGDSIPVVFPQDNENSFDVDSAWSVVMGTPTISDPRILKALWPHDSDSHYRTGASSSSTYGAYLLSGRSAVKGRQEFSVFHNGGCDEIWHFILASDGRLLDKFTLSESCASDADDHSSGRFASANTYIKVSTWYVEYAALGHPQHMARRSTYSISPQGKVRTRHKEWVSAYRVR